MDTDGGRIMDILMRGFTFKDVQKEAQMEMYEAMEDWAEMHALRHEDCSCEECLLRLEEEYDKLGEAHKWPDLSNKYPWNEYEDLGEGC